MIRYTLVLISILLSFYNLSGKTLKGTLTADGEGLAGGSITWLNPARVTYVINDPDGKFEIPCPTGATRLIASMTGFVSDTLDILPETEEINIILKPFSIGEVTVTARGKGIVRVSGAENSLNINQAELFKAACCNLAESFSTNPSVDVAYTDAATGAKQIRLLGLSGAYVRMTAENVPEFRGAAAPYSLGYVPGPWMHSIQVSKGASSVKNGFESITGQINIEFLKPQADEEINLNEYADSKFKVEENLTGNIHISPKTSTGLLLHYEDNYKNHDENHDGFMDSPHIRQFNGMNRWAYFSDKYIMQTAFQALHENRSSGPVSGHGTSVEIHNPGLLRTSIETNRFDLWTKNAFVLDKEKNSSIAFIGNAVRHNSDGDITLDRRLDIRQSTIYGQLLFESNFTKRHFLSVGANYTFDKYEFPERPLNSIPQKSIENVGGGYAEYTFTSDNENLIAMLGLRYDRSSLYGNIFTPRAHVRWSPVKQLTMRLSAGKGYRRVVPAAEYSYIFSTTLPVEIKPDLPLEKAWNYGFATNGNFSISGRSFNWSAEYYYTDFSAQVQLDRESVPGSIIIRPLAGKSYSHTFQAELGGEIFDGFTLNLAYRLTDVKETYNGKLMQKPLTGKYKALASVSYMTPLELWQFDATLQMIGGGKLPASPVNPATGNPLWGSSYPAYAQLSAQVTRHFRHISIYAGGENLTNKRQGNPIAYSPEGNLYDPTLVWGPVHGAMAYIGFRLKFGR